MEEEHTRRADSDDTFEVYNYGTKTTSRHEYYFVTDPSRNRLTKLGLGEWPQDVKLKAAGRPCRQPLPLKAFRGKRCVVDSALRLSGDCGIGVEEFCAARLCTCSASHTVSLEPCRIPTRISFHLAGCIPHSSLTHDAPAHALLSQTPAR